MLARGAAPASVLPEMGILLAFAVVVENHADTLNGGAGTDLCDVRPGGTSATACE